MEVFRTEVHNLLIRPFLDDAVAALGRERVEEMLREWDVGIEELSDPNAWLSLEFVEAFFTRLEEVRRDPALFQRCARMVVEPKYAGFLRPLFRAFGSPGFAIAQVARATPRFNKVGRMELVELHARSAVLSYRPLPGAPAERSVLVCRARASNLEALPVMFDVPPARLKHPKCLHRGDDECRYELRWTMPRRAFGATAGAVWVIALVSLIVGLVSSGTVPAWITAAAGIGLAVGTALYVRDLRRQLADRMDDIADQQDALARSAEAHERRFAELVAAKEHVDRQVEERTAQLREARDRLARALSQLEEVSRSKDAFFANVSHELRTPLTLILAPLEDLVTGREPAGGRERAFAAMHRNASRLLTLINQLLDLAKIDAGAVEPSRTPVDPAQLAGEVLSGFRPAAERAGVRLDLDAPEAMTPTLLDAAWIESAITNLVANALRYARTAVTVRVEDRGDRIRIEVADDGPGMPPDELERVFDRFAQASTAEGRGGTGLGLAIVREAARLHGGEATASCPPEGGTCFAVSLPRVFAPEPARETRPPAERRRPSSAPPPAAVATRPVEEDRAGPSPDAPLALVVEDNDDLRGYIADVLASHYRVRTARDGRTGLARAVELQPHVIVSDISMPDMDGLAMTRELRSRQETRGAAVILVTARRSTASVLEGFEAGADDYVPKPFHGRELLARADVHVRLRQMLHELAHRERLATLGVVAASVAHQVRNPLTVLVSGLPAMQRRLEGTVDQQTRELMEVMHGCARRIERMTVDLLDLSRVDREEQGAFRPGQGLASAVRLVSAGIGSDVEVDAEIDETATIRGRPGDVNHVFLNLVDNAARAVGDSGTIRVRGAPEGDAYVVRVEDSGPGVPEEFRRRIFEPFFTTRPAGQGTGLGLSIARQVVEQHGGRIEAGSSDLGGARFTVRFPAAPPEDGVVAYNARTVHAADRR